MPIKTVKSSDNTSAKLVYGVRSVLLHTSCGILNLDQLVYVGPVYDSKDDEEPAYYIIEFLGTNRKTYIPKEHYDALVKEAMNFEVAMKEIKQKNINRHTS